MNTTYETYMNALKQGLASFDSAAAEEILNDFESHSPRPQPGLSDEESVRNSVMSTMSSNFSVRNMPQRSSLLQTCRHRRKPTPILKKHIRTTRTPLPPPSPLWKSPCGTLLPTLLRALPLRLSLTFPATSIRTASKQAIEGNTFCLREKKLIPSVFWKHLFCNNHQKEVFSFQVPSTVQKLTLRSLNGAAGLDTLSLTTLEISATNGKAPAIPFPHPAAAYRLRTERSS